MPSSRFSVSTQVATRPSVEDMSSQFEFVSILIDYVVFYTDDGYLLLIGQLVQRRDLVVHYSLQPFQLYIAPCAEHSKDLVRLATGRSISVCCKTIHARQLIIQAD